MTRQDPLIALALDGAGHLSPARIQLVIHTPPHARSRHHPRPVERRQLLRHGRRRAAERGGELERGAWALDSLSKRFAGRETEPFQRATTYRNAYQTDLWQELIDGGIRIDPVLIDGGWREIDTSQDLDRARQLVESSSKDWS